jgi:hypothetical protein
VPVCTNDHLLIAFALDFKVLLVAFHRSYKGNGRAQFQIILLLGRMKIVLTVSALIVYVDLPVNCRKPLAG